MVKGNQTQAASVAEESAKGIQKSSTRRAGERTTPQRCEPLGGMVDANVKLVMSVFAHTQAAFDVYIAGLKDINLHSTPPHQVSKQRTWTVWTDHTGRPREFIHLSSS